MITLQFVKLLQAGLISIQVISKDILLPQILVVVINYSPSEPLGCQGSFQHEDVLSCYIWCFPGKTQNWDFSFTITIPQGRVMLMKSGVLLASPNGKLPLCLFEDLFSYSAQFFWALHSHTLLLSAVSFSPNVSATPSPIGGWESGTSCFKTQWVPLNPGCTALAAPPFLPV